MMNLKQGRFDQDILIKCWLQGSYIYIYIHFFFWGGGSWFISCVVCFHIRHLICIILCLCCLVFLVPKKNRTKWFCLHLVVFFPFLLICFEFCLFFAFSFLSKKDPQKNRTRQNPPQKNKNAEKKKKTTKKISWRSSVHKCCSYFGGGGVGFKNADICWKH